MIKFFRKIRYDLMKQNKTGKYFKYAIGEIILVVIGILIALQINNWNQQRIKQNEIDAVLIKIQNDISNDTRFTGWSTNRFVRQDSLKNLVFNEQMDYQDPKNQNTIRLLTERGNIFHAKTGGYDQFKEILSSLDSKYNPLILELNRLYTQQQIYLKEITDRGIVLEETYINYLSDTQPWFAEDKFSGQISDAQIDYYQNNPKYKSQVYRLNENSRNLVSSLKEYKRISFKIYTMIDEFLGTKAQEPYSYFRMTSVETEAEATAIAGTYQLTSGPKNNQFGTTITITSQGKNLFAEGPENELLGPFLRMSSRYYFAPENNNQLFNFEKNKTNTLSIIDGHTDQTHWVKVEN